MNLEDVRKIQFYIAYGAGRSVIEKQFGKDLVVIVENHLLQSDLDKAYSYAKTDSTLVTKGKQLLQKSIENNVWNFNFTPNK